MVQIEAIKNTEAGLPTTGTNSGATQQKEKEIFNFRIITMQRKRTGAGKWRITKSASTGRCDCGHHSVGCGWSDQLDGKNLTRMRHKVWKMGRRSRLKMGAGKLQIRER